MPNRANQKLKLYACVAISIYIEDEWEYFEFSGVGCGYEFTEAIVAV